LARGLLGVTFAALSHRFQIQDIVAQDQFGVVFHALDVATGKPVAVRRFFPFGVDGGGLFDEERKGYDLAVARLAGLRHPGLRAVLTGGCDPVDGIPFVVTEWITGESLQEMLERESFTPAAAIGLLDRALEISEALSRVLGEEAVWVETSPAMILEDSENESRGFTFCISPMRWLGTDVSRRSLLSVAELAEQLLGWRGRVVADQAGGGMGAWVKWLRANAEIISLFQARQSLANATGGAAPEPAKTIGQSTPLPVLLEPPSSTRTLVLIGLLALVVAVAGWWLLKHPPTAGTGPANAAAPAKRRDATPSAMPQDTAAPATLREAVQPAKPQDAESRRLEEINALAAKLVEGGPQQTAGDTRASGVFQSGDTQGLLNEKGRQVTVEGVLKNVRVSDSGKTIYLEFLETGPQEEVRGYFMTKNVEEDMSEQALRLLVGKRIRLSGVVRIMRYFKAAWPEVLLENRQSIQEVP
jgi:hypothetical protein